MKRHIKKGDIVKVLTGNDRGKEGKILTVQVKTQRAIVEGINMVSKHTKPNAKNPKGGIQKQEASVHISNLMVVHNAVASRIGRKTDENGKLVRYSKKTGEVIK